MEHRKKNRATLKHPLFWIVMLGFALRLGFMAIHVDDMRPENDWRMSTPAVRLLEGKGLSLQDGAGPTAYRPPLYIIWLAGAYAIFGKFSTLGPSFLQVLASTGNIVLIYLLAKQIWKRKPPAFGAAALMAIHPYTAYHDSALYHSFLSTGLLLGGTLFFLKGIESKRAPHLFLSGVFFGLCVLVVSTIVPFLILVVFAMLLFWNIAWKRRLIGVSAFLFGMMLMWGPWIVRNAIAFNAFVPLTTEAGVTLWMGNNPQAKALLPLRLHEGSPVPEGTPIHLPEHYDGCVPEERCMGGMGEVKENQALTKLALDWIKTHPKDFVELTIWRFINIWSPLLTPSKTFFSSRVISFIMNSIYASWNLALYLLIMIGGVLAWKEKKYVEWLFPLLLAISGTGGYALFLYYTKYRIPFEAVLIPFAGAGLVLVLTRCMRLMRGAETSVRDHSP